MKKLITLASLIFCFAVFYARADFYSITKEDKAFFRKIQTAVLANDTNSFAQLISYPITIGIGNVRSTLPTKESFAAAAPLIFTAKIKSIVKRQSENSLFKNWQGVMIGNGEIWFSEIASNSPAGQLWFRRVVALNIPAN